MKPTISDAYRFAVDTRHPGTVVPSFATDAGELVELSPALEVKP